MRYHRRDYTARSGKKFKLKLWDTAGNLSMLSFYLVPPLLYLYPISSLSLLLFLLKEQGFERAGEMVRNKGRYNNIYT